MDPISDWVEQPPAPQLRSHVGRYIGYRMLGWPAGIHRGLPAPLMTFIVAIGPPIDVVGQASPAQRPGSYRCVLGGLSGSPALIAHDGARRGWRSSCRRSGPARCSGCRRAPSVASRSS
jgi:hypothetical protein